MGWRRRRRGGRSREEAAAQSVSSQEESAAAAAAAAEGGQWTVSASAPNGHRAAFRLAGTRGRADESRLRRSHNVFSCFNRPRSVRFVREIRGEGSGEEGSDAAQRQSHKAARACRLVRPPHRHQPVTNRPVTRRNAGIKPSCLLAVSACAGWVSVQAENKAHSPYVNALSPLWKERHANPPQKSSSI